MFRAIRTRQGPRRPEDLLKALNVVLGAQVEATLAVYPFISLHTQNGNGALSAPAHGHFHHGTELLVNAVQSLRDVAGAEISLPPQVTGSQLWNWLGGHDATRQWSIGALPHRLVHRSSD